MTSGQTVARGQSAAHLHDDDAVGLGEVLQLQREHTGQTRPRILVKYWNWSNAYVGGRQGGLGGRRDRTTLLAASCLATLTVGHGAFRTSSRTSGQVKDP